VKIGTFRTLGAVALGCLGLALLAAYALIASYLYLEPSLPTVDAMATGSLPVPLRIYSGSGGLIAQIGEKRRVLVAYDDIPVLVREAFVAAEDQHFFTHHGFDYSGVLRAALVDLTSGDFSQGASTITMQAARNMFLSFDKTIRRKLQEIFLTYRMEHEFTKEQILSTYLNVIFLGQRSYGVGAAAETYFGKPLDQLSVAEAATLAGIPQAPSRFNPVMSPKGAQARRRYVLQQMQKLNYIDAATAQRAATEEVSARDHGIQNDVEAPYVAEMVRADLVSRYGEDAVNAGYRVYTTIDGRLQTAAGQRGRNRLSAPGGRDIARAAVRARLCALPGLRADRVGGSVLGAPAPVRDAHRGCAQARGGRITARRRDLRGRRWPRPCIARPDARGTGCAGGARSQRRRDRGAGRGI
jgi:penicillin-binding protein 1A